MELVWLGVSRYSQVYRDMGAGEIGKAVLQYSHCTCNTAQALGAQAGVLGARALGERASSTGGAGTRCYYTVALCCDTAAWLAIRPGSRP